MTLSTAKPHAQTIRVLPEDVANKIAAGEVVERPASAVKELVENALDAGATRITVQVVAAGRRLIEVTDNGHGMSEQNALLAIERHATSKVRTAADLEAIHSLGFRGEALASIASVSRFTLVTRREQDQAATRIRVDGGVLREVDQCAAPVGTRVTVNRLYFNTPVRAKFLKGITTELGHCIDAVQRHALTSEGVAFQFIHNERMLLDVPAHASLRDRIALIWGLNFVQDMTGISGEKAGFKIRGMVGLPGLTRAQRSHQLFFLNQRPVVSRTLQYGFEDGYRSLVTIGRHPVGVVMLETHPRFVDVNIHPTKKEVRFRDERAARDAVRDVIRDCLARTEEPIPTPPSAQAELDAPDKTDHVQPAPQPTPDNITPLTRPAPVQAMDSEAVADAARAAPPEAGAQPTHESRPTEEAPARETTPTASPDPNRPSSPFVPEPPPSPEQESLPGMEPLGGVAPAAMYRSVGTIDDAPLQIFDTYLLVPDEGRLLIIDQHALHERLNYDALIEELEDNAYESQQLAVPIVLEVAPSQTRLVEKNLDVFERIGMSIEHFGGNTFQVTGLCHLYDEGRVRDAFYRILDQMTQGDLFDQEDFLADLLRLATRACKASVRAGDRLTPQERRGLLEGFRRLRPPYTCPHGRPIITELTQHQMEKSFRRIQ